MTARSSEDILRTLLDQLDADCATSPEETVAAIAAGHAALGDALGYKARDLAAAIESGDDDAIYAAVRAAENALARAARGGAR